MNLRPIVTGLIIGALLASCARGKKQYRAPEDQRKNVTTTRSDLKVPSNPNSPGAGLVPGQFVDLTQEELDQRNEEIARRPVLFGQGMGGVTRFQNKSEIEKVLGTQGRPIPDSFGTYYLFPSKVLAFYLTGSENPYFLAALPGYLGTLTIFGDQKIGLNTDMRAFFGDDPKAFTRKLYNYFAQKPEDEDCNEKCLFNTFPNSFSVNLQDFGSISVDKTTLRVQQFTVVRREVEPSKIAGDFDLFNQAIQGEESIKIGDTFGDLLARGGLQTIKEDFSRSLNSFSITLANGISFNVGRSDASSAYQQPSETEKVQGVYTSGNFQGGFILNNKLLSFVPMTATDSPEDVKNSFSVDVKVKASQTQDAKSATQKIQLVALELESLPEDVIPVTAPWRTLLSQVFSSSPSSPATVTVDRSQVTELLRGLINVVEAEAKAAYPNKRVIVSRINGQMNEAFDAGLEASVSIIDPIDFTGKILSFSMRVNEPDLSVSTSILDNKINSLKPYRELLASNDFSYDIKEGGQQSLADYSIGSIVSLEIIDAFYKYSQMNVYQAELVDGQRQMNITSTSLVPYAENAELKVANSVSGQTSVPAGFTFVNTTQVFVQGTLLYLAELKPQERAALAQTMKNPSTGTLFKVVAVQSTVDAKGAKVKNVCFDGKAYQDLSLSFGSSDQFLMNSLSKNKCQYMIDSGTANLKSIPAFYLPRQGIQLIMSENVLTDIMFYDISLTTAQ